MRAVTSEHRQYLEALRGAEMLKYARVKYGNPYMLLPQAEAMRQAELRNLHLTESAGQHRHDEQERKRDQLDEWLRRTLREKAASVTPHEDD
ncbi:hypothetical protein MALGJ_44440 [Mycolicibacter algericus]|uniref:Uncharacterized protein n=2 Tax=Mycolicibacter algericus TaxID=1288388 RepID=A0A7I9YGG8_MYCAL|nr:hypothetical protein MALGJ_44440 [Mycolicibacter algericus]